MPRIVAGALRHRKLNSPPSQATRPITDRAKETLFENLGGELQGERVADVCAGTGTIGLEAISRGAQSVVFFERDYKTHAILKRNVEALGVETQCLCWRTDILRTSFQPQNVDAFLPFDLVFFDPPYQMTQDMRAGDRMYKSLQRLAREQVTTDSCLLLLRTPVRCQPDVPVVWQPDWTLKISSMMIHAFQKSPVEQSATAASRVSHD
ncbi:MAG: 16S rRNA (guanine(966)-N(2))-methyltransferase RsmD [Planctomycetaceae bacterium]